MTVNYVRIRDRNDNAVKYKYWYLSSKTFKKINIFINIITHKLYIPIYIPIEVNINRIFIYIYIYDISSCTTKWRKAIHIACRMYMIAEAQVNDNILTFNV